MELKQTIFLMYEDDEKFIKEQVFEIGKKKKSASDGISCDNKNKLYLTDIENNAIYSIEDYHLREIISRKENSTSIEKHLVEIGKSKEMIWPDTIGFDRTGFLYFTTNNLCEYIQDNINNDDFNFFIYRIKTDSKSYIDGCEQDFFFFKNW